jgi:hypothetical protein
MMHCLVALVQGHTLEDVWYHLKTQLGITDENYQHCARFPIYGTGQGSGNSPPVWLVISSILFDCYEHKAHSSTFESPNGTIQMRLFRSGFVDNTASFLKKFLENNPPSPKELISMLTHDSQVWCNLLWKSGRALELPKFMYYFWSYQFTNTERPYLQGSQVAPDVLIQNGDCTKVKKVPALLAYESYRTLGYYKSPCISQKQQFDILQ